MRAGRMSKRERGEPMRKMKKLSFKESGLVLKEMVNLRKTVNKKEAEVGGDKRNNKGKQVMINWSTIQDLKMCKIGIKESIEEVRKYR